MSNNSLIHVVGATGAGTTTLGKALERELGYKWMDTDGHFWMPSDPPYSQFFPYTERVKLISKLIRQYSKCVICGSMCGWGDVFIPSLDLVVFLYTPTDVRIERLERREYERFGDRIRKGGDMYEEHIRFIEWSKTYDSNGNTERFLALHEEWFKLLSCPLLRMEGTLPVEEMITRIKEIVNE